jgi:hypothetical protein
MEAFISFSGVTCNGNKVVSASIIQKEMPDGLHVLLARNGGWVRILTDSLKYEETKTRRKTNRSRPPKATP